jgi:hypothetical protein
MNFEKWKILDTEIKDIIFKNGYMVEIVKGVKGGLIEVAVKTSYGYETLFCGNNEAGITVDVDGIEYHFDYVIDSYGGRKYLVNF